MAVPTKQLVMEQQQFPPQSVPEAWDKGFTHDFVSDSHGQIYCLANPERLYSFSEYKTPWVISDALLKCATILIETTDGMRGIRTDFWE